MAAAALMTFGMLADGAGEHADLSAHDPAVTLWFVRHRAPLLTTVAQVLSTIGSEQVIGVLTVLILLGLLVRQVKRSTAFFGGCMGIAAMLTLGVKQVVARPRPPTALMLGPLETNYSFPSGHTLFSTVFFGVVAGLVMVHARDLLSRTLLVVAWAGVSSGVGISRLYLGYHWLTDVLASYALAVAVLSVAALLWSASTRHGPSLAVDPGPLPTT